MPHFWRWTPQAIPTHFRKKTRIKKSITKICEKLEAESGLVKKFLVKTTEELKSNIPETPNYQLLNDDIIEVLSNWYYFAILEVMNTVDFQSSYTWIASKLSVSVSEIKIAVERLVRLKLMVIDDGQFKRTNEQLTTYSPGETSAARRAFQKQVLAMAMTAIDEVPIERRDMTNMTMAIDVEKIPEARRMITKFRRELCEFLETGERKAVFQLGIQLYPLSKT